VKEVRLIGPDGAQLGVKQLPEALSLARSLELDLVEIAPMASPPVCKILDYGKYRYELAQRDKESRRKAQTIAIKEMKYRPKIGGGDFDTKTRKVGEFLAEGHKVKITIMFRGREVAHPELGKRILDRVAEVYAASAKVEAMPKLDGKNMIMVLAPEKKVKLEPRPEDLNKPPKPSMGDPKPARIVPAASETSPSEQPEHPEHPADATTEDTEPESPMAVEVASAMTAPTPAAVAPEPQVVVTQIAEVTEVAEVAVAEPVVEAPVKKPRAVSKAAAKPAVDAT
jgi:translation initiation factor IF-3